MRKKTTIMLIALGLAAVLGFGAFAVWQSSKSSPVFDVGGYVLQGESEGVKWLSFRQGDSYSSSLSGGIHFTSVDQGSVNVPRESFVHFDNGSVMAFSDGVLLDFGDLSENFINNYYISAGLRIAGNDGTYTADTTMGTMEFGEHLWKISDRKYMIVSPKLKVHMSEGDVREVYDYVQVAITDDYVVHLLMPDNLWMTISEECYIETEGGVRIYPVRQLIDDGSYKLSIAKLAVSVDDAIVLTEDETRRQIVPELNITGIDGEDGQDGQSGQMGRDGEAGKDGSDGEDKEDGKDGVDGGDGENRKDGEDGKRGPTGNTGSTGKDAVVDSSTSSALPTMSIKDWRISATDLKGAIGISDVGSFLEGISNITDYGTKYPGTVTITNLKTGKVIPCYQILSIDAAVDEINNDPGFDFYKGAATIYFSTRNSALEPDTEYRLSVTAYYKSPDNTGMIYSRQFISRTFFTDSAGVVLASETATKNSVTLSATVSNEFKNSIESISVYLMTPQQNGRFTLASVSDTSNYVDARVFNSVTEAQGQFSFPTDSAIRLTPNTKYVARVIVETNQGKKILTNQELNVMTLKREPTFEKDQINAYYNRVTGAFEVRRPVVEDLDGGAVSYTYTAYRLDGAQWVEGVQRTITPSTGEPVEFRLESGETYRFGVKMEFHDNEKTVVYDLGVSESLAVQGDTMPKMTLTPDLNGVEYNAYKGTLRIQPGGENAITVDANHPLKLEFYADQILEDLAVEITNGDPTSMGQYGTITMDTVTGNSNYLDFKLDLKNLYKNTGYTVTVSGYLDVHDENGTVNRVIGTVSFRTSKTLTMKAAWSTPENSTTAFARTLSLKVQDSQGTEVRNNYALDQLKSGQVTLELFSGTGTGKLRIAQKNITETESLTELYSATGLKITEDTFNAPPINSSGNYTLTVSTVADSSYALNLGYVNEFEEVLDASEVVSAEPTPPDLLTDSSKGVAAKPILNKEAAIYGGTVDANLPEDAIVGYTLEASYDNVQRIGKTITYYAFEYNTFFNALRNNKDPIKEAAPLMKMTQNIDDGLDTVPKVAVLFGGTKTEENAGIRHEGYMVYYAGAPDLQGSTLISGMGRGYRYLFAYTVEYAGSSTGESISTRTYPYGHKAYAEYNRYHGGLKENNVQVGKGLVYVLNSGMCEAPLIMPDFHTYVYRSAPDALGGDNAQVAAGNVELHYRWRDPDNLITTVGTSITQISYPVQTAGGIASQEIITGSNALGNEWYTITVPYTISRSSRSVLAPTVNISEYYLDYTQVLEIFRLKADETDYPIGNIPLDWSWTSQFNYPSYNGVLVSMLQKPDENRIDFYLAGDETVRETLSSRAVAMELKFTASGAPDKTILLPLTKDVSGIYARLATGLLGSEYIGKTFTVTADILYDTGRQGWQIAEQSGATGFALQFTNDSTDPTTFGFSNYLGASNSGYIPGNGALLTTGNFSAESLRALIGSKEDQDSKLPFSARNLISESPIIRYLYPDRMGVDVDNSSKIESRSESYAVPKEIGRYNLTFSGSNTGELQKLTPVISYRNFRISSTVIGAAELTVSGIDNGSIFMAVYDNSDDAFALSAPASGREIEISLSGGQIAPNSPRDVTNLAGNTTYFIAFYYIDDEGEKTALLREDTGDKAVYQATTSDKARIEVTDQVYRNSSYFDKELDIKFSISRIFNLSMRYDIYTSEADAQTGTNPLLSYEEMATGDENEIMSCPTVLTINENRLRINLSPSQNRKKLVPGGTYYLKFTAREEGGTEDAGSLIQPFTIDPVGNYGALVYVKNATSESIEFQVTIHDPQYSLMGRKLENGQALYAVRFTDANGNLLKTTYDDKVFSAQDMRKVFVLNDETLRNDDYGYETNQTMQPERDYQINIYAVPDTEHDGTVIDRTWETFFDNSTGVTAENCGGGLNNLIDTFWNNNLSNNTSQDSLENTFLIATKRQGTTTSAGWLLNENAIYLSRQNSTTVQVTFQESVGLIDNGEPVFKKIEWMVDGWTSNGTVRANGTELYSNSGQMLEEGTDAAGNFIYLFEIPHPIGAGTYTVVLQFYLNQDDSAPIKTITIRSGV